MSRGGSYGGGRSSLGYLFGNDDKPTKPQISPAVILPPYGIDTPTPTPIATDDCIIINNNNTNPSPNSLKHNLSNNYPRAHGQNSGNFLTDRPSTRVNSAPGGGSSLGYLFGDK